MIFLRALGHRRLWITRFWVGNYGVGYYYAIVDWDHRVLADWDESEFQWDIRDEAWKVEPDSRDYLPEDVLVEIVSEEQLFQLSTIHSFL
ncbi:MULTISPECIES: hypothetical protein [Dickeya]|uniref:hypothetical protein n=1 Tax=Dickeya TaxID=204037 RepID=UPI000A65E34F|nr:MULTISPECIES: hypothetical protein [Dickeya]